MKKILTAIILIGGMATALLATPALIKDEKLNVTESNGITISALAEPSQERLDKLAAEAAAMPKLYIVYEPSMTNPKVKFASQPVTLDAAEIIDLEGAGYTVEEIK